MALFLIGVIGLISVGILCAFLPCFYSQAWGSAHLGSSHALSLGDKNTFSLYSVSGIWSIILIIIVCIGLIIYTICMLTKHSNLVAKGIIYVLSAMPFIVMLANIIILKVDSKYVKVSDLTIGGGVNSGSTAIGIILFILTIIFAVILSTGFTLYEKNLLQQDSKKGPIEIKIKEKKKSNMSESDFKF